LNTQGYSLEILRNGAAIEALAREWSKLPQSRVNPLLAPEWFAAAAHTFEQPAETLALRRQGALVGVAPLGVDLRAGVRRLQPLGVRSLHEPSGLLYRDAEALQALCKALIARRSPFILQRMPLADPLRASLACAARRRGVLHEIPTAGAPCVHFAGDGDVQAFEAQLSARRLQDFRRARRGLERLGPVTFDLRQTTVYTLAAELEEAMRIEASSWKSRAGTTPLRAGRLGTFYHDYAWRQAVNGNLRIAFLRVGDVGVAMQIMVEHDSRLWVIKVGYDEQWAEHSPGVQLMWEVMRYACAARFAGVELLGLAEGWTTIWARDVREYRTLIFYPFNLRGLGAALADVTQVLRQKVAAVKP